MDAEFVVGLYSGCSLFYSMNQDYTKVDLAKADFFTVAFWLSMDGEIYCIWHEKYFAIDQPGRSY
jgi:hypothetical protein